MNYTPTKIYLLIESPHHKIFKNNINTLIYTENYCLIPNYIWDEYSKSQQNIDFDEREYIIKKDNQIEYDSDSDSSL